MSAGEERVIAEVAPHPVHERHAVQDHVRGVGLRSLEDPDAAVKVERSPLR